MSLLDSSTYERCAVFLGTDDISCMDIGLEPRLLLSSRFQRRD